MADFRSVQTRMWREDEWFQSLPLDARLFWIYLFTNPSASICGMYRLPIRTMANESGLSEKRIRELFDQFSKEGTAGKAFYEDGTVWVVRMRENQLGPRISPKQQAGIDADIRKIPPCPLKNRYLQHYEYPIDTLSAAPDTLSIGDRNVTLRYDTVTDTHTDSAAAAPPAPREEHKSKEGYPPAVQAFLTNGGKFPAGKLADGTPKKDRAIQFITEHVKDSSESLEFWSRVVCGYTMQWSATSYQVMVNDYYLEQRIPGEGKNGHNGNGKGNYGTHRQSSHGIAAADGSKPGTVRELTAEERAEWDSAPFGSDVPAL